MFNEAIAIQDRAKYVLSRAKKLLSDPLVEDRYKNIIKNLLAKGKIYYVEHLYTRASSGNTQVMAEFFGVTAEDFSYIKIGGKNFNFWIEQGNEMMIPKQIDFTILHEVKHILIQNNGHYPGFDNEINAMTGLKGGYTK